MLCGLCLVGVFFYSLIGLLEFKRAAVRVAGTVVKVQRESHATGRLGGRITVERPIVKFVVPDSAKEFTAIARVISSQKFLPGEVVNLEFLPNQPDSSVRVESGLSILELAFGFVGISMVCFCTAEKWRYRRDLRAATS
jgi:hypothetical protein